MSKELQPDAAPSTFMKSFVRAISYPFSNSNKALYEHKGEGDENNIDISSSQSPKNLTSYTSFPSSENSSNTSNPKILHTDSFRLQRETSAKKIQQFARRKRAQRIADAEHHWKIFADLDTIEENEMVNLAHFMQILMDQVPNESAQNPRMEEDDDNHVESIFLDNINIETHPATEKSSSFRRRLSNPDVPFSGTSSGKIDPASVQQMIEVIRTGGTFSSSLVTKILRKTYALLKQHDNIVHVKLSESSKCTVVGDLHGQLSDLICILDESGPPSETNLYIFNGDFVDRGPHGVEVMCILMAMMVVYPGKVILNRGNHEDGPISRVYGFHDEVLRKYDALTFGMFAEVFKYLPLFVLLNEKIFVVHGGLFNHRAVTLSNLSKINRTDYMAKPAVSYPECIEGMEPQEQWDEYYKQLQRDALWSDPTYEDGLERSHRGAGVIFGPDVCKEFMTNNDIAMIIRSHECVREGFYLPFVQSADPMQCYGKYPGTGEESPLLCTVFSASNYCHGDNSGAYLVLLPHDHSGGVHVKGTDLYFSVHFFKTSESEGLEQNNRSSIHELIMKKRSALSNAFEAADSDNTGFVPRTMWSNIMQDVTKIKIRWLGIISKIVPKECTSPSSVNYRMFLSSYSMPVGEESNKSIVDSLYGNRKQLEVMFNFFDVNKDGVISRDEFITGCSILNQHMPSNEKLTNVEHMLELMDLDGDGNIDVNEFFEAFRLVEAKLNTLTCPI